MQYKVVDVESEQYKQDERRLQSIRTMVVLWLIVLALGVVMIPLMLIAGWVRSDMTRLEAELLTLQNAVTSATTPSEEVVQLGAEVARIKQLASAVQTATVPTGVNWPYVVGAVAQYDEVAITLSSLTQTNNTIRIVGSAMSNDAVVRYQQRLLDSGAFSDVAVISMVTVLPTALPPATPEESEDAESEVTTVPAPVETSLGHVEFVIDLRMGTSAP